MSDFFYWLGLVHAVVYVALGSMVALIWLTVECWGRILNRRRVLWAIIKWTLATKRWNERHEHGLSDEEWKRGEPKPQHFAPPKGDR